MGIVLDVILIVIILLHIITFNNIIKCDYML